MRFGRLVLILLVVLPLFACRRPEPKPEPEADYLLVDRQVADFTKNISPDGVESAFAISCDATWEVSVQEDAISWITIGNLS